MTGPSQNKLMIMWKEHDNALHAELKFENFTRAFSFMMEVAFLSEKMNHHPEWTNVYNRVTIKLNTHDAGNIVTEKDRKMSERIEEIYKKYQSKAN